MKLIKEQAKSLLWRLSPRLYNRTTTPYVGQVFSIGVCRGISPLELQNPLIGANPILTAADVHDVPASFVADPFIVNTDNRWYLFFEVYNHAKHRGEIALATSMDSVRWRYERIVIAEPHHLAYPQIIKDSSNTYMIPDSPGNGVNLYRAERFPDRWRHAKKLLDDPGIIDPTVFRHEDRWWMISGAAEDSAMVRSTRLHFANEITGPWTEHPASPIVREDPRRSRPAGSVVSFDNRLFILTQDCAHAYGESVNAYEILELTTTTYRESGLGSHKVLMAGGERWRSNGMHHANPLRKSDGEWIAAVDGWYMQGAGSN